MRKLISEAAKHNTSTVVVKPKSSLFNCWHTHTTLPLILFFLLCILFLGGRSKVCIRCIAGFVLCGSSLYGCIAAVSVLRTPYMLILKKYIYIIFLNTDDLSVTHFSYSCNRFTAQHAEKIFRKPQHWSILSEDLLFKNVTYKPSEKILVLQKVNCQLKWILRGVDTEKKNKSRG